MNKLANSIKNLKLAIEERDREGSSVINDAGVTKCFEVALEYAWKALKKEVENQGLEVYGPKDSIKLAANLNLIDNPELWITFINNRNLSVHDYLGVDDKMYFENIRIFISESEKVLKKIPVA